MAAKQTILQVQLNDAETLEDYVSSMYALSSSQRYVVMMCARPLVPCELKLEQRTAKGPVDLTVKTPTQTRIFKISQRAKLRENYAMLE